MNKVIKNIESITIDSWKPWLNLLIFGAIHWNEVCWPKAIYEIIEEFKSKKLILKSWKITFVPICNKKAYEKWSRYIDANLNRVFQKNLNPSNYEENIANILTDLVDKCDILLDIHSTHSDDKPFVFLDFLGEGNSKLAKWLWIKSLIIWWPQIYKNTNSSDTQYYSHKKWKISVTVECWNHNNIESIYVAKKAIINTLINFNFIDWIIKIPKKFNKVLVQKFIIKTKEWKFIKNWSHLNKIKKWETIAVYNDWEKIVSKNDWFILLPFVDANIWDEWFYIWKIIND